jgi:hypothetical protein
LKSYENALLGYKNASSRLQKCLIRVTKMPYIGYNSAGYKNALLGYKNALMLQKCPIEVTKMPYEGYKMNKSHIYLSTHLPIYPSTYLSIYLSIYTVKNLLKLPKNFG